MSMRYAVAILLAVTPAVTSLALAQDGSGHGPPNKSIIVTVPTLPTTPIPTTGGSLSNLFQPKAELSAMFK
jgi:hypothetical protein